MQVAGWWLALAGCRIVITIAAEGCGKFHTPMEGAAMKQKISCFSLSIALIYPFSYGQADLLEMMMEAAYNYAKSKLTMLTAASFK